MTLGESRNCFGYKYDALLLLFCSCSFPSCTFFSIALVAPGFFLFAYQNSVIKIIFNSQAFQFKKLGAMACACLALSRLRPMTSDIFKQQLFSAAADCAPWTPHLNAAMSRRQEFTSEDKMRLGDYTLGTTLGEGEFGKVKIGWKKEASTQVAVKIIRKEKLDSPGRMTKVHREIAILKQLDHPNIVHLYEMVETDHTIGIILEYASGGELFDYILQQRHLNDDKARRLFAQLVSGVGYLHRNGIIHRDLKLENLLLDSKKNIIITDFGFANTFDPMGRSNLETDYKRRADPAHLKSNKIVDEDRLAQPTEQGYRHEDFMSTSCGSPCYAAPELVVSDGLYSGKKVDVWSCGVILYAMLAGYLPFDDDPDNPEGDNINLLYKYICTTPLIFPNWVSAHARDILKRILVPEPRDRADLFEVARHSWLMDYAHIVEHITSDVKLSPEEYDRIKALQIPVHEFSSPKGAVQPMLEKDKGPKSYKYSGQKGGQRQVSENLANCGPAENERTLKQKAELDAKQKPSPKDQKRRTVQVEYVPPKPRTLVEHKDRIEEAGEPEPPKPAALQEISSNTPARRNSNPQPRSSSGRGYKPPTSAGTGRAPPRKQAPRSTSDTRIYPTNLAYDHVRPGSIHTRPDDERWRPGTQPSYGQPSSAEVQQEHVQGQMSAPKDRDSKSRLAMPPSVEGANQQQQQQQKTTRTHKRSSTLTNISDKLLNRGSSIKRAAKTQAPQNDRSHPPTSMRHDFDGLTQQQQNPQAAQPQPRKSGESFRRSFGFSRKNSDISHTKNEKRSSRRFSILPAKKFSDNYESKSASSGASQRVMDFFRRRR